MSAFDWITQLLYVAAAVCFVLGLHLMNTPATARRGNQLSTGGMVAAIAATYTSWMTQSKVLMTRPPGSRRAPPGGPARRD